MTNDRHFRWWSTPARQPQNGHPKVELDQLGRRPLETCCKMSSITQGTTVSRTTRVRVEQKFVNSVVQPCQAYEQLLLLHCFHVSLENRSEIIRWSLDLRWQRPDKANGFYGLKDSVLMRTSENKDHVIDWTKMAGIKRTAVEMAHVVNCFFLILMI